LTEVVCDEIQTQSLANLAAAIAGDLRDLNSLNSQAQEINEKIVNRTRTTVLQIVEAHGEEIAVDDTPKVNIDEETKLATLTW